MFVTIDETRCAKDGICVNVCPMMLYRMEKDGFPTAVKGAEAFCMQCGHCIAACPHGALSLHFSSPEKLQVIDPGKRLSPESLVQHLKTRRSIRRFKEKSVPGELLTELLDTARYAPSGKNSQPVKWIVVHGPEKVHQASSIMIDWARLMIETQKELAAKEGLSNFVTAWERGKDLFCYNAQSIVIAYGNPDDRRALPASLIATTYVDVLAPAYGLGACWAGYLNFVISYFPPMRNFIGLAEGEQAFGCLLIGYPKYKYHRIPKRKDAVITWK